MNLSHRSARDVTNRFAKRLAVTAMCVGAAYGCAASSAEADGEAALSAEGVDGVTPAEFGTVGPVPTPTVTTPPDLPPAQIAYHKTLDLNAAGSGVWQMARDTAKRSPYRVRLTNADRREIQLSVRMDTTSEVNPITCPQYRFSYVVEAYNADTSEWVRLLTRFVTGSYSPGTGSFPVPHCNLTSNYDVDFTNGLFDTNPYTQLRVLTQGHRKVPTGNDTYDVQPQNMTVFAESKFVPDPPH